MMKHCTQTVRNILRNHQQITTPILWSLFSYFFTSFFVHSRNYTLRNDIKNYLKNSLIKLKHLFIERSLVALTLITVTFSCGSDKQVLHADLNLAIRLSGENRPELEKVLRHYSAHKSDSLKLKAAKFLISNMIRHYSIGGEYMDGYMKLVDSVYADKPTAVKNIHYSLATRAHTTNHIVDRELDLLTIKADYLIKNIDYSLNLWENSTHLQSVSFDDFCEYVLPYNVNHEPLREWKDSSMFKYFDMKSSTIYELDLELYNDYIKSHIGKYVGQQKVISPDSLIGIYSPDCIDRAFWEVMLKRSVGVPATVDYVPHFPTSENRHYWVVNIDEKYLAGKNSNYTTPYTAKVYRKTYSMNPTPEDLKNFVPNILRDTYSKDVTELYGNVSDVKCDLDDAPSSVKYGYLAVFNNLGWKEVAWSKLKRGRAVFEKMGNDVMYMPTYYDGKTQKYGKYPLHLTLDGTVKEIIPNKTKRQKLTLKRKFPYTLYGEPCGNDFIGCDILACDDLHDPKFDTLATISSYWNMAYDTVFVRSNKKYKNWMLRIKSSYFINIAELAFLNDDGELPKTDHYILDWTNKKDTVSGISKRIFDDNLLTSASVNGIVGLSFKEPVSVTQIKYISNNDENGIYPNDEYELFYFDNGDWMSLGRKIATNYSIEYDNAPTDALFWLRNRTKGKEERPFMVNDGKVRFW